MRAGTREEPGTLTQGAPVFPGSSRLGIKPKTPRWLVQDPTTSPSGDLIPTIRGSQAFLTLEFKFSRLRDHPQGPGTHTGEGSLAMVEVVIRGSPARSYNAGRAGLVDGGLCIRRAVRLEPTQGGAVCVLSVYF